MSETTTPHPPVNYTHEELNRFRRLVHGMESSNGVLRVVSRLDCKAFELEVGKEKCDAMFEVLKKEIE